MGFRRHPHRLVTPLNAPPGRTVFLIQIYVRHVRQVICIMPIQMSEFPARIYGGVLFAPQGLFPPVVAQVRVLRVSPGHFLLVVGQSRVVHVSPGPLHRHRVKAAARLVPPVYPANIYIVNVIQKAIQFV